MNRNIRPDSRKQPGQILVMFAVGLIVFMGIAALAVDVGFILAERRGIQNAADASAMAAARHMARGFDQSDAQSVGLTYADLNGYPSSALTEVDVVPNDDEVIVTIRHQPEEFFLGVFRRLVDQDIGDWRVEASATARILSDPGPYAIIALGYDSNCQQGAQGSGIEFFGNSSVAVSGGSIASNACVRKGGGSGEVFIEGNIEAYEHIEDNQGVITQGPGSFSQGGANQFDDPYENVSPPICTVAGGEYEDGEDVIGEGTILTPGRYTNGNLFQSGDVNLLPGVYCIQGSINHTGGSGNYIRSVDADYPTTNDVGDGGGVILFFTDNNGGLTMQGQANVQIRALGMYDPTHPECALAPEACEQGFVVWVHRASGQNCPEFRARGGSSSFYSGVIYAPCSHVSMGGNPDTEVLVGQIVADSVAIYGNATFDLVAREEDEAPARRVYLVN